MNLVDVRPWLYATALACLGASLLRRTSNKRHIAQLKQKAREEIAAVHMLAADKRFELNGAEAAIESIEETGGSRGLFDRTADLSVTAQLRNSYGEKFLVKWHSLSDRGPFVKHLPAATERSSH